VPRFRRMLIMLAMFVPAVMALTLRVVTGRALNLPSWTGT